MNQINEHDEDITTSTNPLMKKNINRKVQEEPQAEAAANPRHQE